MTARPRATRASRSAASSAAVPRDPRWPFGAIAAAGIVAYANALNHPFVFDDAGTIVGNPTIRSVNSSIWGGPAQGATAGRPLVNIALALNYAAGGVEPLGYHVTNLALHIACALLLFALLRRLLRLPLAADWSGGAETGIAAAVALLWVVHPLNSEVVNYATQRTEAMMALAFLGTLYCGVRALTDSHATRWRTASVVACAAGMACKESMVTAPVMMLILESAFTRTSPLTVVRQRASYYGALVATWILLAALIAEGPRWRSAGFASGVSPVTYLLNQPSMIARYLRLAFWPTGLVLDYGEPAARTPGAIWPSAALVIVLLGATLVAWRRSPLVAVFATWFFVTLSPTSSIVPIATEVGAERRMYLPLVAVLSVVVLVAWRALQRIDSDDAKRLAARGGLATACVVLAALTMVRNHEYSDTLRLWQTVVERWPSGRAHYNFGTELKAAGRRTDAVAEYRQAVVTWPDAEYALGFELHADGLYDEALAHYRSFIARTPADLMVPRAYHQIGRTLLAQGRRDEALASFREVLARTPDDPDALAGIADTLLAQDRLTDAVAAYQAYLRVRPESPDAMMNLGIALVKLDRDAEARDLFAAVVRLQPGDVGAHVNLAYALANTGRYGDSVREFRRAAELEKDPAARAEIEAALGQLLSNH